MEKQLKKFRQWQKEHPEWELICDMPESDSLYFQWHELSKKERMHWVGRYGEDAKGAFEEFAVKRCKIPVKCLGPDLKLYDDWQLGHSILVFKTNNNMGN